MMKGEYNPKSKSRLQTSWRGIRHRFPKTLSTFQIAVVAGFLSLLILRSTMGTGKFNLVGKPVSRVDQQEDESNSGDVNLDGTEAEPMKRNLVQEAEHQIEKLQQLTRTKVKEKLGTGDRDQTSTKATDAAKKLSDSVGLSDPKAAERNAKEATSEEKKKDTKEVKEAKPVKAAFP